MKRILFCLLTFAVILTWSSCRKDFDFEPNSGTLKFSRDTVYLDTIFSNIGSSTYNLKVYNRSNNDISIPSIRLTQGESSKYRLNVDGLAGKLFEDIELLANDSLFIFIETTVDIEEAAIAAKEFLYTDAIEFDSGERLQKVELVTLIKDAVFIYPNRDASTGTIETLVFDIDGDGSADETNLQGRFLSNSELTFTNEKPYVIYGYAAIPSSKTLIIEAGARIHFHANSGLLITDDATLHVNGALSNDLEAMENEVIFEGDRLEPIFEDVPGQWGTLYFLNGSKDNSINYATIKNSTIAILSEGNQNNANSKVTIKNSQIYNSSNFGIFGAGTSISAENVVINNSGQASFAGTYGGNYNFIHCTLANYWNNSFRQLPAVVLNNFIIDEDDNIFTNDLDSANFKNCIIFGNSSAEISVEGEPESSLNFKFSSCLIQYQTNTNPLDLSDLSHFENNIYNQDPDFKMPYVNQLTIGQNSAAKELGNVSFASEVPLDLVGTNRLLNPDSGAYQSIIFEED